MAWIVFNSLESLLTNGTICVFHLDPIALRNGTQSTLSFVHTSTIISPLILAMSPASKVLNAFFLLLICAVSYTHLTLPTTPYV